MNIEKEVELKVNTKGFKIEKKNIGNVIWLAGLFLLLMLNLNTYDLYLKMTNYNYYIVAFIVTAVFLCYMDIRSLIRDKFFWLIFVTNLLALTFLVISGTGVISFFPLYSLTLIFYLSDKIIFSKWQWILLTLMCGAFFVYWTIDVKGYFKGYSVNFGGIVLLYGFVFVIGIFEFLKWYILCKSENFTFLKKYPYFILFAEAGLFVWAYKIMSWYRSRTAVAALFILAVFMCIPWKMAKNKLFQRIVIGLLGAGNLVFPILYVIVCKLGLLNDREIFYKPLVTSRYEIWPYLINMIRKNPLLGSGTIVTPEGSAFRSGLLDSCNGALQLLTAHGVIVTILVAIIFIRAILGLLSDIDNESTAKFVLAALAALMVANYSENSILSNPFILMFAAVIFVANSIKSAVKTADSAYISIKEVYSKSIISTPEFRRKFVKVFCVSELLLFMYIILGPLEIFYSNYNEFMYNTSDFIIYFVIIAIVLPLVISLILMPMPEIVSTVYCVIILSVSIVSYIQYMFINGDLVDENGNFAAAVELGTRYYISVFFAVLIPITVIIVTIVFKNYRDKIYIYSSLFLTAIMLTGVVTIGVNLLMLENKSKYVNVLSGEDEFELATDENTIVLLFDTFGREALNEELAEDEDYLNVLADFTYYEKADSVYAPTYPSLVHLLTEYEYEKEDRIYMEPKAFESSKSKDFFGALHDNGYKVGLYTRDLIVNNYMYDIADNTAACKVTVNKNDVRSTLFKMSVYRYVPYIIKPYFEVYNPKASNVAYDVRESYAENYEFYNGINGKGMTVNPDIKKKFTLCHLEGGIHLPYVSDENLMEVPINSVSKHQVIQGINKLLDDYFNRLKENGLYDKATIVVMADHGERGNTDAIFFVKKPNETHEEVAANGKAFSFHEFQDMILESIR